MTKPLEAELTAAPFEWPSAAQAAFAAALHFLLPKGKPALELRMRAELTHGSAVESIVDLPQPPGPAGSVARLLKERSIALTALDLPSRKTSKPGALKLRRQTGSLGGVYTVTFLDLGWKALVPEITRVLVPDGIFAVGASDEVATDIHNHMEVGWEMILQRNDIELKREGGPRFAFEQALDQYIQQGAETSRVVNVETIPVCRWSDHFTPRSRLEATKNRRGPQNRHIPDLVFGRCLKDY